MKNKTVKENRTIKLFLQDIANTKQFIDLPPEWIDFDFVKFSNKKKLFDYQQGALKNALKILHLYYKNTTNGNSLENKKNLYNFYKNIDTDRIIEKLSLQLNKDKLSKIFDDFTNDYPVDENNNKIPFYYFINRMSFWKATGSGKTLVIVKLIELLSKLIKNRVIPENDILFLTYRDDLIEQFKIHVNEFNSSSNSIRVNLIDLKEFERVKLENRLMFLDEINVFYYRSDLISDEQKDKIINFRNYDNNGKWYILLDEAHKGDKEDSKRQMYYSILSRNGFLFNFSATFTDIIDLVTCVYNFNLSEFIKKGYGKKIFLSTTEIQALGDRKDEFSEEQKKAILLKVLTVSTLVKLAKDNVGDLYHNPLIMVLGNSVNTDESDLELFFKELVKIAQGKIEDKLFEKVKEEILDEFKSNEYVFNLGKIEIDGNTVKNLSLKDILQKVFNTNNFGNIEVLTIPGNTQELVFKHINSDMPFALLKIGDIKAWIQDKLDGYTITERFEDESFFRNLNQPEQSHINLLLGSRSFYEGWDSNRPNIILYINIGKGKEGKKFVLQSMGRGVRIEPQKNIRQRISVVDNKLYNQIKDNADLLESLFVFGTKSQNINDIINILNSEHLEDLEEIGNLFEENTFINKNLLPIPKYKIIETDEIYNHKFELTEEEFNLLKNYCEYLGKDLLVVKYDFEPKRVQNLFDSFNNKIMYKINRLNGYRRNIETLLHLSIKNLTTKQEILDKFEKLTNEIVHFKHIKISKNKVEQIKEKIKELKKYIEENPKKIRKIKINGTAVRYMVQHYYLPLILADEEKTDYFISHVIRKKSEIEFLNDFVECLSDDDNIFKKFDEWYFSKIDETTDNVYIPYYNSQNCQILKFNPDFIFWCKKDDNLYIIFIDPKSTEFTQAYRKIDGYKKLFMTDEQVTEFQFENKKVKVFLFMYSQKASGVPEEYRKFWIDDFDKLKSISYY